MRWSIRPKPTFGRVDILVCCAGILGIEADFLDQSAAQFDKVMKINLYGTYYAHQAALPHMLAQNWGRCVSIPSAARFGAVDKVPYAVSKAAVYSFILSLGNAYPKQNVFVNGVEPGRALTNMVVPRFSAEFLANPGNPIGRYSDAEEVAEVIEFLVIRAQYLHDRFDLERQGIVWLSDGFALNGAFQPARTDCLDHRIESRSRLCDGAWTGAGGRDHRSEWAQSAAVGSVRRCISRGGLLLFAARYLT